jgi:hypothetical protein
VVSVAEWPDDVFMQDDGPGCESNSEQCPPLWVPSYRVADDFGEGVVVCVAERAEVVEGYEVGAEQ